MIHGQRLLKIFGLAVHRIRDLLVVRTATRDILTGLPDVEEAVNDIELKSFKGRVVGSSPIDMD